ncbi:hypothetical protein VTP01DRAFT_10071 [Rhizomucor pusillus]|uniref:uncharacterized protein n=1 Tax=Rhizomucor pusillus TaxID=4840 RepID=UPI00374218B7
MPCRQYVPDFLGFDLLTTVVSDFTNLPITGESGSKHLSILISMLGVGSFDSCYNVAQRRPPAARDKTVRARIDSNRQCIPALSPL